MKTRLFAAALIFFLFVTGIHPTAQAAGSTVTTIYSTEDTYVDNAKPTTNYGSIVNMWIRGSSPTRRGLLRFNLSAIPANAQISSAVLKLSVSSDGSPVAGNVYAVNGSWTESTVTYSTAPQVGGLIAALPNPATPSSSVSVDLTSSVIGKSSVTFYITTSNSDGVIYYTREKGSAQAPRLTITWSTGSTPTTTPTTKRTSTPTATSTQTPSPSPTPLAGESLSLPLRLAFYYPWFPEAWTQGGIYPYTNYNPTLGFYDSSSIQIINQHIADMQYAGIQGGIASWWGQGSLTDGRINTLLNAAVGSPFKWTLYYEPEGTGNPTASVITSDLAYIFNKYAQNQSYMRIGGKPVLFVHADARDGCSMANRWKAANTLSFYVVLKVFSGYTTCANQPNGWHQYGPASNYDQQGSYSVTISPGFWKKGNTAALTRDINRWNQDISNMVAAHPDFQLIATWNEWGEGTSVESSLEFGRSYLDALHNNGQPTPTPEPPGLTPTSSPTHPPTEDQSFTMPTNTSVTIESVSFVHVAQTFTAGVTGALNAISIDMASTSYGGELEVVLMGVTNGVPDGTFLAYRILTEDELRAMSAGPLLYLIPMPDIFVTAGTQYAIEVNYISYSNFGPPQSIWSGATGNLYSGGSTFTSDGFTDWQPMSDPGLDLHFRTFVITGVPISDLSVTRKDGADKATACSQFSEIYIVTNNGPDTAEQVVLGVGGTDQFDLVSLKTFPGGQTGPFTLAPGQSMQFKAVIKVTAFVPGESREGRVEAHVSMDSWPDFTIDPIAANDSTETIVWLQGEPRTSCQ